MKVVVLSYYFPPTGGAAAQRPTQFVRHLAERGHEPVVVTAPGPAADRWTPSDPTLVDSLPSDVEVLRVPGPEPARATGWRSRGERWLGRRSAWTDWWVEGAFRTALAGAPDAEVVYTVISPYETAEAAARLARAIDRPWVPDLGDPWALDDMMVYATALHRRAAVRKMERDLSSAAAIVLSTPDAVTRVRDAIPSLRAKLVAIPNGYDQRDFAEPVQIREDDGILRVVHTGYLHTELGQAQRRADLTHRLLGGGSPGVDILTRSHVYLLRAVNGLIEREPALGRRIEVHLAGVTTATDEEVVAGCPAVRLHGYLPHAESVALIRTADLLFLPMQKLSGERRAGNVPGKTYEYLATGRPILAAVPRGDARDLLLRAGVVDVCEPDDVEAIERALRARVQARIDGAPPQLRDRAVVDECEWGRRAGAVIDLLERTAAADVA